MKRLSPRNSTLRSTEQSSPERAYQYALKLLAARDYTVAKLRVKLCDRGFDNADIEISMARLEAGNWLNDLRFAERFAETAVTSGRFYGPRLKMEMRRRGIPVAMVDEVLGRVLGEYDGCAEVRSILERRFPGFSYATADAREKRRVIAFFARRGFSMAAIMRSMRTEEL